jgi:hypothetical protein
MNRVPAGLKKAVAIPLVYFLLIQTQLSAQVIHAGIKGGFNYSWVRFEDAEYRNETTVEPVMGFNAGIVAAFKMKDRFFLHTELLYSKKGRIVKGPFGSEDKTIYNYIELPLTYNIYFKGKLGKESTRYFKWYAGIGPNFSYWLSAKGSLANDELREYFVESLDYEVRFGERPASEVGNSELVYYKDVKRMQLGVNIGGGILLEPRNGSKVALDIRFELGHTWLGTPESSDFVLPATYEDNLRARNMGLRISGIYMLEFNTDKKVMNKGKSTKKKRRL